jgi:hypothetical protein
MRRSEAPLRVELETGAELAFAATLSDMFYSSKS